MKWDRLAREGVAAGYFDDEVGLLDSHAARGAYEWLVSLHEVDRRRQALGPRLHELTLDDLTGNPAIAMRTLCDFLGLDAPPKWLTAVEAIIDGGRHHVGGEVMLPPSMCDAFNRMQRRFNFAGRARPQQTGPANEPCCEAVASFQ